MVRLLLLIVAGETIFALPFHLARFFRPTLLLSLGINNAELGWMQSAYGLSALVCYAPGGWLADRVPARYLLPAALGLTGLGGVYMTSLPSQTGLLALHLYWGATTILLFWGALLRATRDDAPDENQGRAFGVLEAGRGLLAALVALAGVALLGASLQGPEQLARDERLRSIIWMYTIVTFAVAVLCFWGLRHLPQDLNAPRAAAVSAPVSPQRGPAWRRHLLHGAIILAAYSGYKGLDFCSTFASEVFAQTEVQAARWATWGVWLRPPCALLAGLLADRYSATGLAKISFGALGALYLITAALTAPGFSDPAGATWVLLLNVVGTSALLYGLRSLYFAQLAETGVARVSTGTAVGIVSLLGYTPDFFFPALAGALVESQQNAADGYALLFVLLAAFALLGLLSAGRLLTHCLNSTSRDNRACSRH